MAASNSRYTLTEQLNFIADTGDAKDVVVTVQHWTKRVGRPGALYVVCYNGKEANRRVCNTDATVTYLKNVMAQTRTEHGDDLLSEEGAATAVRKRGGPELTWCHRRDCGEPVPYAAAFCADGHPAASVGRIEFESAARKLTAVSGGPNHG